MFVRSAEVVSPVRHQLSLPHHAGGIRPLFGGP